MRYPLRSVAVLRRHDAPVDRPGPPGDLSRWAVAGTGLASSALGATALVGWFGHVTLLLELHNTWAPVAFNSALGLFLLGTALIALAFGSARWALPGATYAIFMGTLSGLEAATGRNLGIDQVFFAPGPTYPGRTPGRVTPATALELVVAGLAVVVATRGKSQRSAGVVAVLGSATFLLAALVVFGFTSGVSAAYGLGHLAAMAGIAAFGMTLVGAALVAEAWRLRRPGDTDTSLLLAAPVGAAVITLIVSMWDVVVHIQGQGTQGLSVTSATTPTIVVALGVGIIAAVSLRLFGRMRRLAQVTEANERKLRSAVESMLDCFGILAAVRGPEGSIVQFRFEFVNDASCEFYGLSREQLLGRLLCDVTPTWHSSALFMRCVRTVETGEPFADDQTFYEDLGGDGLRLSRAFEVRAAKLGDGVATSFRDVTERKATEELRRRAGHADVMAVCARAFLDSDDELASAQMVASSLAGVLVGACNLFVLEGAGIPAVAVGHGDPRAEIQARELAGFSIEAISPIDVERIFSSGAPEATPSLSPSWPCPPALASWAARNNVAAAACLPMRAEGQSIGVLIAHRASGGAHFEPDEIGLMARIAERSALMIQANRQRRAQRKAIAALSTSEEQFRLAFDHSPSGLAIASLEPEDQGRLLRANPALSAMTGFSTELLVALAFRDLLRPREADPEDDTVDLTGRWANGQQSLQRFARTDGRVIWVQVSTSELPGTPRRALVHIDEVTAQKQAEEDLTKLALHDQLTGLANRQLAMERLSLALKQLGRRAGAVAVAYLDLDHFKRINDTLGHDAGDEALRHVATRLASAVRTPDTASRLGGDEFLVICAVEDTAQVTRIVERLQRSLSKPVVIEGRPVDVTASIGVTSTTDASADLEELVSQADAALYEAKHKGRNRWEAYNGALQARALRRTAVERDLRDALAGGWFRLHYQPIFDVAAVRIVGVEALLRLEHPVRGVLYPESFIEVAEDSDLIGPSPTGYWRRRALSCPAGRHRCPCAWPSISQGACYPT